MYLYGRDDQWSKEFTERTKATRRKVKTVRTTSIEPYLDDYSFFTCAPLYVHARVGYSLPDQFEIEAGPVPRLVVDYQRTIIGGIGDWGRYVEGIANEHWDNFCHYLSTVMFLSRPKQLVWVVRAQDLDVEGTAVSDIVTSNALPVRLKVFLPDGNKGRMYMRGGYPAKLWWEKPHKKIVEMSQDVLTCEGRIDDAS